MELKVRDIQGKVVGSLQVREDVFGVPMNPAVMHQVVVGQEANARQGTASTKTRGRVSGGGRKPRPQKYTGRARQGSIRAPQWRGGGVVFGPRPRSFRHHTPRRLRRQALLMALSDKVREGRLIVLQDLDLPQAKTKAMAQVLDALEATAPVLLVGDGAEGQVLRSARNLPRVDLSPASVLNARDLLRHRTVIMTVEAVRRAEELWGRPLTRGRRRADAATEA